MEKGVPVIALLTRDKVQNDVINAINEVKARGADIIGISTFPHPSFNLYLPVPESGETQAIMNIIPLQLLAYYLGVKLGNDVDKPRNIAKKRYRKITIRSFQSWWGVLFLHSDRLLYAIDKDWVFPSSRATELAKLPLLSALFSSPLTKYRHLAQFSLYLNCCRGNRFTLFWFYNRKAVFSPTSWDCMLFFSMFFRTGVVEK